MESTHSREGPGKSSRERLLEGFPPQLAPPSLQGGRQEAALTVDAPRPGEEFRLRSSGFPIGLSSRDRSGFLLQFYSANGGFLLLNREVAS